MHNQIQCGYVQPGAGRDTLGHVDTRTHLHQVGFPNSLSKVSVLHRGDLPRTGQDPTDQPSQQGGTLTQQLKGHWWCVYEGGGFSLISFIIISSNHFVDHLLLS